MPHPDPANLPDLPLVQHGGERVLTTDLLAKVYGVDEKALHDNHQNNRGRFVEGVHFHRLSGDVLKAFKNLPDHIGVVAKRTPHLIVWTERGAARHAKLISTDEAWTVFGRLEDSYFDGPASLAAPTSPKSQAALARDAVDTFKCMREFSEMLDLDRNQAILSANRATRRLVGLDLLDVTEHPLLEAPHQEALMTVTELGMRLGGIKVRAMNLLLTEHGFQNCLRDPKNEIYYEATDLGRQYSRMVDQDRAKGSGAPILQLRWLTSAIEPLRAAIGERPG